MIPKKRDKNLVVQKYGGTSVTDQQSIERAAKRILSYARKGKKVVAVVSAMGKSTDSLIELAKKINPNPSEREMDMLVSTGEQISCALLAMGIHKRGGDAVSFTGPQVGIITDTYHSQAKILKIEAARIKKELKQGKIVIIAGFQGLSTASEITTLGRGGSDLSAVALAVSLGAGVCEIYTDVDGIYTADPKKIKAAKKLSAITFDEMLELASAGSQVMYTRAIEVAKKFNVCLHVRSSFSKKEGSLVMEKSPLIEEIVVRGVTLTEDEAKITICDVPDRPGIAAFVFDKLAKIGVNIDMIVQNVSRNKMTDLSFTVASKNLAKTINKAREIAETIKAGRVNSNKNIAKILVVGIGMKSHSGVAARCFSALARNKINIDMISTSEISISCVVKKEMGKKALGILHREFGLGRKGKGKR